MDARHAGLDLPRPGRRVTVVERADGSLLVRYGGATLSWREVSARPAKPKPPRVPVSNNKPWKPAADHPFRRPVVSPPRPPAAGGSAPGGGRAGQNP